MFYVDHFNSISQKIGVADSSDGIIEEITRDELRNYQVQGVDILEWDRAKEVITQRMLNNCNYKFYRALSRMTSALELKEYLKNHSIYTVANFLNNNCCCIDFRRDVKFFDYTQTKGYVLIIVYLNTGSIFVIRADDDYQVYVNKFDGEWIFGKNPSGSGLMYKNFYGQKCDLSGLSNNTPYIHLVSKNDLNNHVFLSHFDMSFTNYVCVRC